MEIKKPDWKKLDLCAFFLEVIGNRISDVIEVASEEELVVTKEKLESKVKDLKHFYTMVFNVAFFEFSLAYADIQTESSKIIEDYLKKKSQEEGFGGDNGKIF